MIERLTLFALCLAAPLAWTPGPAVAQSCHDLELDTAAQKGAELTTLLKIANFRADVNYMGEIAGELEGFLNRCGEGRLALVCDYDCHLQLGRYSLFLASDLPFLSAAGAVSRNDTPLSPQGAQDIARQGLEVVERGLRFLARQQGASGGDPEGEEAVYRTFVRRLVLLSALKIQLLMSTGDTWYQTVSEARIKQLDFLLAEALGSTSGAGVESQPNLSKAYTNYEAALWTLVETKMDIPGESTYDDLRADLLILETELQRRLESIRRGHLFLGIDPLQFTTIRFEELERRIAESRARLERIEATIEAIVERWHANRQGEATRQLDEERTVRNQEINLIAHRIGKMEREAQVFALGVQEEINKVDAERDTFTFRQQIRNLEIALASKIAEFENRQQQLNGRRELDLIVLEKEAEIERRGELRWLLSWEMTQMNLDLQLSSIETQLLEYQRQKARSDNRRAQISKEVEQKERSLAIADLSIAQAEAEIERLELRRTEIHRKQRAVNREAACRLEAELAFVGAAPATPFAPEAGEAPCEVPAPAFTRSEYTRKLCGAGGEIGLRKKLANEQIRARAFVLQCVVGDTDFRDLTAMVGRDGMIAGGASDNPTLPEGVAVDCGSFSQTETDFARQIWEAETALFEKRKAQMEETRDEITDQIESIEIWIGGFMRTVQYLQAGLAAVEGVVAAFAAVPTITVAAAGLASGVYTEYRPATAAEKALGVARTLLATTLRIGQIETGLDQQLRNLGRQLTASRQQIESIDYTMAVKSLALHETHFQLAGRRAAGVDEIKELMLRDSLADLDCQSQQLGVDERIATLRAEHARQMAAMDLQSSENQLIDFDIAAQERRIEQTRAEIEILGRDIERLALADAQLVDDNTRVDELIAAAEGRRDRVLRAQLTVTGLADESQQATNAIAELRERQQQAMLALNETELGFIERRIADERSNTEEMVGELDRAIERGLKRAELTEKIRAFQAGVQEEIQGEEEDLMALVSQIDDPAERRNLFIANQETLADLLKGIPEYVVGKRRVLQTANLVLHLMRRRFAIVQAITGSSENWPSTYVKNATQLGQLVDDLDDERFFNEDQINIDAAQIVVPANSGFARRLALTDRVLFEVSPIAATEEEMRRRGFFSLWNPAKFTDQRNMTLIDLVIGVQYPCTGPQRNRYFLAHKGNGVVFRPLAEGSSEVGAQLVVGPERSSFHGFYNLADSQDDVNRVLDYWVRDRFQVRSFPRASGAGPPNDTTSVLPYLGAPLIGSYELAVGPADCTYDGAVFTLHFIFSSTGA